MYKNIEMKSVMANWLQEKMREDDRIIVIDADLARANGTLDIRKEFPDRALDVGVAECNMASIGAGLASYGFMPFILTFCPFATRRICDQVAISIAYAKQNVKIVGTDPGLAAALNGGTHMTMEDVGVMRSIPGMVIFEPVDGDQLVKALPRICEYPGVVYIRLFRKIAPKTFFNRENYEFDLFAADILREGEDVTIFATGIEVKEAMEAAEVLADQGVSAEVINVHTIKPIDRAAVVQSVRKTQCAVTCENHNILGGLGSAVAEVLANEYPAPMEFIGMKDSFSEVGKTEYLVKKYNMDAESIQAAAKRCIEKKRC